MRMRHSRIMSVPALAVAACALAVAAAPASAHQFTASAVNKTFPLKTKGEGLGTQAFKFGKIEVECSVAKDKGTIAESPAPLLKVEVSYKECESHTKFFGQESNPKIRFKSKVEYVYHPNGYAEVGTEGTPESVEVGPGTVEIAIPHTGGCKVLWPTQTVPVKAIKDPDDEYSAAVFSNETVPAESIKKFPNGFQQKLVIANEFKGMEFSIEESGLCENFEKTEFKGGKYTGELQVEVGGGNLGFE
jgi:hypothetical protein